MGRMKMSVCVERDWLRWFTSTAARNFSEQNFLAVHSLLPPATCNLQGTGTACHRRKLAAPSPCGSGIISSSILAPPVALAALPPTRIFTVVSSPSHLHFLSLLASPALDPNHPLLRSPSLTPLARHRTQTALHPSTSASLSEHAPKPDRAMENCTPERSSLHL